MKYKFSNITGDIMRLNMGKDVGQRNILAKFSSWPVNAVMVIAGFKKMKNEIIFIFQSPLCIKMKYVFSNITVDIIRLNIWNDFGQMHTLAKAAGSGSFHELSSEIIFQFCIWIRLVVIDLRFKIYSSNKLDCFDI